MSAPSHRNFGIDYYPFTCGSTAVTDGMYCEINSSGLVVPQPKSHSSTLLAGVALNNAVPGETVYLATKKGTRVTLLSDGTAVINPGDRVAISGTTAGTVAANTTDATAICCGSGQVPATALAHVDCLFGGSGTDANVTSSTLAGSYAAGSAAADQTMLITTANGGPVIAKGPVSAIGSLFKVINNAAAVLLDIADNTAQTIRSAVADGASAVGLIIDTTTTWANATAKLQSWRTNTAEVACVHASGDLEVIAGSAGVRVPRNQGIFSANEGLYAGFSSLAVAVYGGALGPVTDNTQTNGDAGHRWSNTFSAIYSGTAAATIASSGTIAPANFLSHITGTTVIDTITAPTPSPHFLAFIADNAAGVAMGTGAGNIGKSKVLVQNQCALFFYDGTNYYPVS